MRNYNSLIDRYPGADGMKTGFICASGYNLVASATRNGKRLIAVVLGSTSGTDRTVRAAQLLDDGFAAWGGTGYSVASMPPSGTRAPNICDDVRRRGGGVALADDADISGPIAAGMSTGDANSPDGGRFAIFNAQSAPQSSGSVATRSPRGRVVLGPRAEAVPMQVSFGRSPGSASAPLAANATAQPSSRVARGTPTIEPEADVAAGLVVPSTRRTASNNGATPRGATAFAASPRPSGPSSPIPIMVSHCMGKSDMAAHRILILGGTTEARQLAGLLAGDPRYDATLSLAGRTAVVTSGPTHEPIDPVRYIANRSSGRQGHAIAAALARLGADVTLVSGPVTLPDPRGVLEIRVERAEDDWGEEYHLRNTCCLAYRTEGGELCQSCPLVKDRT